MPHGERVQHILGFDSTSNVRAGKLFDIPVSGTPLMHSFKHMVMSIKHLRFMQNDIKLCVLVDTFHTLKSGAIKVAKELEIPLIL